MLNWRCRSWRHPRQPQDAHQSLHMFAIYQPSLPLQNHHHPSAAVKRVSCKFFVNQRAQNQIIIVRERHRTWSIYGRPRYTG
jgi:hypothetical protein